jgi:hypothetical protein
MSATYEFVRGDFRFFPASGEPADVRLPDGIVFLMRLGASGRRVLTFPAPYSDLEIVEDERVGGRKWARIKAAIAALTEGH